MSGVTTVAVAAADDGIRLDRWFKRHYPGLAHGRLEKLLRTGQVRVDGARAKAADRLNQGQQVRVPPLPATDTTVRTTAPPPRVDARDVADLKKRILFRDDWMIVLDKPAGLAVQGGSGQTKHLDAMLDGLRFDGKERPRLVHRLDRDTSGVLVLARSAAAASKLAEAFRDKTARKLYWAITAGVPKPRHGKIDLALAKIAGPGGERMMGDDEDGKRAVSLFRVIDAAPPNAALVGMMPLTGRTHQLRAHCAFLKTPILGDFKYGGPAADLGDLVDKRLMLHARRLVLPHPKAGTIDVAAELPPHFKSALKALGLQPDGDEGWPD